jgi:hypothetical protein
MCHCFTLIVFLRGVYNECLWCAGISIPTSLDGWSCRPISILLLSSTTYCYYYYYYTNCFSNSLFKSTSCRMKYTSVECAPSNENRKFSSRFSDKLPFTMYHHVPADSHYALQHRNITTSQNPLPRSVSLQRRARRTLNPRFFIGLEIRA